MYFAHLQQSWVYMSVAWVYMLPRAVAGIRILLAFLLHRCAQQGV
jgi:hypothetical protein